jgi:hypothetical protein
VSHGVSAWRRALGLTLVATALATPTLRAADNTATGDIAGDDADLTDSNTFTILTTTLEIVKTAFLTDGTQLASGASLPVGTRVEFMVYVDNPTGAMVEDVNVEDVLEPAFRYEPGTLRVVDTVPTGASESAIHAAASVAAPLSDAIGASDVAGISGSTINAGAGSGNARIDIPGGAVWALVFTVTMQ